MGARIGVRGQQSTGIRVLFVDSEADGSDDAVSKLVADDGFDVEEREHAAAAIDALEKDSFDCVVSGYDLTQLDGIGFLEEVRERWNDLPFVLYTDSGSERIASEAFSAGATDYIDKDRASDDPTLLRDALQDAVEDRGTAGGEPDGAAEVSDAGLDALFESFPDPAIRIEFVDGDAVVRDLNAAFEETFGFATEALVGRSAGVLQVPATADGDTESLDSTAQIDTTVRRMTTDGTETFRYRTVPFTAADGTTGLFGIYTELTDTEPAADLDREPLDAALARTRTGAWAWEPSSDRLACHAATAALFGIESADSIGTLDDVLGRVHPVDRKAVEDAFERALESGHLDVEFRIQRSDGERRWIAGRGETRDEGDTELVGVFVDVTERRRREDELRRYRRIVETTSDPVYVLDEKGRFEFVNDAFLAETGFDREDVIGQHVSLLLDEEDVAAGQTIIHELRDSDLERGVLECEIETGHGTSRWCEINIALLEDDDEIDGTVGVVRDITDRKERERELERQTERLEEFASVVAHDLRNPLTVAIGHAEVLQDEYDDEFVDRIVDAHERMERLIDGLLALARQGQTVDETEPVPLRDVAKNAWGTVATADGELTVETTMTVDADRDRLRTLFENLFRNAVEHGGEDVTVTVGTLDEGGFDVADDGPGVPPGDRETVFERGYSTNDGGTGFGLAIVDRIADAHGWDVRVTESEHGGARFEVTGVETD